MLVRAKQIVNKRKPAPSLQQKSNLNKTSGKIKLNHAFKATTTKLSQVIVTSAKAKKAKILTPINRFGKSNQLFARNLHTSFPKIQMQTTYDFHKDDSVNIDTDYFKTCLSQKNYRAAFDYCNDLLVQSHQVPDIIAIRFANMAELLVKQLDVDRVDIHEYAEVYGENIYKNIFGLYQAAVKRNYANLIKLASSYYKHGELDYTQKVLFAAIDLNPNLPRAYLLLGNLYGELAAKSTDDKANIENLKKQKHILEKGLKNSYQPGSELLRKKMKDQLDLINCLPDLQFYILLANSLFEVQKQEKLKPQFSNDLLTSDIVKVYSNYIDNLVTQHLQNPQFSMRLKFIMKLNEFQQQLKNEEKPEQEFKSGFTPSR